MVIDCSKVLPLSIPRAARAEWVMRNAGAGNWNQRVISLSPPAITMHRIQCRRFRPNADPVSTGANAQGSRQRQAVTGSTPNRAILDIAFEMQYNIGPGLRLLASPESVEKPLH